MDECFTKLIEEKSMDEATKRNALSKRSRDAMRSREQVAHQQRYQEKASGTFQCNYLDLASDGVSALLNAYSVVKTQIE